MQCACDAAFDAATGPLALLQEDTSVPIPLAGCNDSFATNFDAQAEVHMPSYCVYPSLPLPPALDNSIFLWFVSLNGPWLLLTLFTAALLHPCRLARAATADQDLVVDLVKMDAPSKPSRGTQPGSWSRRS